MLRQEPFLKSSRPILHLSHLAIGLDFQFRSGGSLLLFRRLTGQLESADLLHLGDGLLDPLPSLLKHLCLGRLGSPLAKPRQFGQLFPPFRLAPRRFGLALGLLFRRLLFFAPNHLDASSQIECLGQSEFQLEAGVVVLGGLLGAGGRLERLVAQGTDREPAHPYIREYRGQPRR